jgi:hypothetical protein
MQTWTALQHSCLAESAATWSGEQKDGGLYAAGGTTTSGAAEKLSFALSGKL